MFRASLSPAENVTGACPASAAVSLLRRRNAVSSWDCGLVVRKARRISPAIMPQAHCRGAAPLRPPLPLRCSDLRRWSYDDLDPFDGSRPDCIEKRAVLNGRRGADVHLCEAKEDGHGHHDGDAAPKRQP